MVRAAAGNLPEQNQNNKCVNRPPGTAVKKYAGTYDLPCTNNQRKRGENLLCLMDLDYLEQGLEQDCSEK